MKIKNFLLAVIAASACAIGASAEVALTINGQKVEKSVARMTFDGDMIKVEYADNSTSSHDMEQVALSFASSGMDAAMAFGSLEVEVSGDLYVTGVAEGCRLLVFDVQGREVAAAVATGTECTVITSHLEPGLYILKAGKNIVKFVKR